MMFTILEAIYIGSNGTFVCGVTSQTFFYISSTCVKLILYIYFFCSAIYNTASKQPPHWPQINRPCICCFFGIFLGIFFNTIFHLVVWWITHILIPVHNGLGIFDKLFSVFWYLLFKIFIYSKFIMTIFVSLLMTFCWFVLIIMPCPQKLWFFFFFSTYQWLYIRAHAYTSACFSRYKLYM